MSHMTTCSIYLTYIWYASFESPWLWKYHIPYVDFELFSCFLCYQWLIMYDFSWQTLFRMVYLGIIKRQGELFFGKVWLHNGVESS